MLGLPRHDKLDVVLRSPTITLSPPTYADRECECPMDEAVVDGVVRLQLSKPKRIQRLSVRLIGIAKFDTPSASTTSTIMRKNIEQDVNEIVEAGEHCFAFHFTLPSDMAATVRTRHGRIDWMVKARMHTTQKIGHSVKAAAAPLQLMSRPPSGFGRPHQIMYRVAGLCDNLGPYRFQLQADSHIGGGFLFTLSLPSSSPGVQLCSVWVRLQQTHNVDLSHCDSDSDTDPNSGTLPVWFPLVHESIDCHLCDEWPQPGPSGTHMIIAGRMPLCTADRLDPIQPTTPVTCRTPLRISHEIVLGLEFCEAPGERRLRLQASKRIKLRSCDPSATHMSLPTYSLLPPKEAVVLADGGKCACACEADPIATLDHQIVPFQNPLVKTC